jgi:hypothetical protein
MYLCPRRKKRELHSHLVQFHKLTSSSIEKICRAIKNNEDPSREILFESTDTVIDQINHYQCPYSIYNHESTRIYNSSIRSCRSMKPQIGYTLRHHLVHDHRIPESNAKKLVKKIKANTKDLKKN